jgi:predicted lipoprotein with Yx(FWY)xxD motif
MGRSRLVGAAALPLILVLAACGGGATPTPSAASPSTPATSPSSAPASPSGAASPSSPAASPTSSDSGSSDYPLKAAAGGYLTGKDGLTLYVFAKDSAGKSACNGQCASAWPPYEADDASEVEAEGATGTLSIITRDDGSKQLAYNGAPLYYFGGDKAAGDTNGSAIPSWSLAKP